LGTQRADTVAFGQSSITIEQSYGIVTERAFEQLRAVVDEARAELGLPEDAVLDTSPEATAERILEFALGQFGRFQENHEELGEDEARQQFVDLIGGAIGQGISEAREILGALSALTPEVDSGISTIESIIEQRLQAFAENAG
jgi:hypothetical protein